jgi:exosortase
MARKFILSYGFGKEDHTMTQRVSAVRLGHQASPLPILALPLVCAVWAYWTTLAEAAQRWAYDPQYSHGYLVPAFATVILWLRRSMAPTVLRPSWWGVPLLAAALALRLAGTHYYFVWLDAISFLPCLAGLCLMVGGVQAGCWAWPAIAFLVFMIPLPYRLEVMMADPLQHVATVASTFALQTLGFPALAEGNTILLNEVKLGIVEACSGLRMLVIFFALSTAVTVAIKRPLWEKLVIVASAIPIALLVNITRITVTGILHDTVGSDIANAVFHDLAGWLMMPLALGLLWVELTLLKRLLIETTPDRNQAALALMGLQGPPRRKRTPWKAPAAQEPSNAAQEPSKLGR